MMTDNDSKHYGWNLYHYAVYGYQMNCSYLLNEPDPTVSYYYLNKFKIYTNSKQNNLSYKTMMFVNNWQTIAYQRMTT